MKDRPQDDVDASSLSLGERAGVRASRPNIREASIYGGRGPELPRKLREEETHAEHFLWRHLRNRGVGGAKFRRQQALGSYILDFYCHEYRLVVEVDGGQHLQGSQVAKDVERTVWLNKLGLKVLRFNNREVLTEITAVLETILRAIEDPSPSP